MSNINNQALREAAAKFRETFAAHCQNPKNYDALDAWDKATSEFASVVNNDELNIIASLLDEMETEEGYRKGAFLACSRWHDKFREAEAKLEAAEKHIAELEKREPDLYLCRVVRNGEDVYSPCGKDYPRGRGYYAAGISVKGE
ncbi:ead/Ea22-like family protein [Enterobacter sp. 638]|uniref:Ead/Ea22-like family protein n=1 Tax=Enterobacter sp. (strain 638) TaxID=399742 RepID=A0A9J9GHC7_ENT38|nr:ead/Ea22-like family protein [Enterobacter sp. 638]ABP61292.1 hypothetical protein Ent638_2625 [Enterobacter sp. 638]